MNEHDQRNLEFLLAIGDGEEFDKFISSVPLDDINYALELLQTHTSMMLVKELELQDDVEDISLAATVINKIKENNNA